MDSRKKLTAVTAAAALVGTVLAANYLTDRFGFIPVGFGQAATAGTLAAGAALALRDAVQDLAGRWAVLALVAIAAILSYVVASPALALASAAAFAVAELADLAVYNPLRRRGDFGGRWWAAAVVLSGLVGALVDTLVFLTLAFGWAVVGQVWIGQMIGKAWAQLAYLILGKTGQVIAR